MMHHQQLLITSSQVLGEKDPVCNLSAISGRDVPGRDMIILSRYLTQL